MKNHLTLIILISVLIISCNSKKEEEPAYSARIMKYSDMGNPSNSVSYMAVASNSSKRNIEIANQQRMIIKTANITAEVNNYDTSVSLLQKKVIELNGYIVSSSANSEEKNKKSGTIVIRIPTNTFEGFLVDISNLSLKVLNKSVRGNDISEEYYDISARLENKKKIENRYREILKSAKTVEDILSVEKYLGEVREEIESIEGRKRYLSDQVMLSTITINFREPQAIGEYEEDGFWSKISKGFRRGLYGFGDVFAYSITFIISSIPAIVLLSGIVFVVLKLVKGYRSRKNKI